MVTRLTGACLPRESDMLVVMWKYRWLPLVNLICFIGGTGVGFLLCLNQVTSNMRQGNACMDGTQIYPCVWLTALIRRRRTAKPYEHHQNVLVISVDLLYFS